MNHVVKAKMLRESDEPIHYNCAQSLFVAFSDVLGVSDERAFAMGANYGGGMMHGGTCGVVSAGLMILSLAGIPQEKAWPCSRIFPVTTGPRPARNCL